jgi:iron(III) transport system substrate-binding protein
VIGAEGADPRGFADGKDVPNQKMTYPTEGVFIVSSPTAVIKGARNPNAARLFAEFMISPVAQKMIADAGIHSSRQDIAPPAGQPALSAVKFIPADLDHIEDHARGIKAKFSEIFQ